MTNGSGRAKRSLRGGYRRAKRRPYRTTLLGLVQKLIRQTDSDREVVAIASRLVRSGRVVLTGSFRGERLDPVRH